MHLHRPSPYKLLSFALGVSAVILPSVAVADVWVFEPTAAIDQRFDDNYTINNENPDKTSATRIVGTLGLSREAPSAKFAGLVRVDGLITQSDTRNGALQSNQVGFLSSQFTQARSEYGIGLNYKRDTPSRDISADITDISSVAADTGASVTQDSNVGRQRFVISPNFKYNLTRRTTFESELNYTQVKHDLPSAQEALDTQCALTNCTPPADGGPITIAETGFFTVFDELDDFKELALDLGVKTKLTPISTLSFFAGYSDYVADSEPDPRVEILFDETSQDPQNKDIRRKPKRETRSNTMKFRIGYDRAFTQTLNVGVQVGIYTNETDKRDLLRPTDNAYLASPEVQQQEIDKLLTSTSGYLANITATKTTGVTRYSAKFGVDVLPSDIGSQVESLEAVGDLFRQIGPLLDFSFRVRAYEPDAVTSSNEVGSKFARRFLSIEPKLIWRFSRAWTVAGSYRYRRQKSQIATSSAESNALLFSIKYTPPSAIRDAELAK